MFRRMMQQRAGMICLMVLPWLFCSQAHANGGMLFLPGGKMLYVPGYYEYFSGKYKSDEQNIALLKELKPQMAPIRIAGFNASDPSNHYLVCRGSYPVSPPGDIAYHAFLAEALRADLVEAGMYSEETGVAVNGYLKDINFSSFMKGEWTIEANFSVAGKEPMTVKKTFEFSPAAGAVEACSRTSNAMVPAIQAFLHALYSDPKFKELVGPPAVNNEPTADKPTVDVAIREFLRTELTAIVKMDRSVDVLIKKSCGYPECDRGAIALVKSAMLSDVPNNDTHAEGRYAVVVINGAIIKMEKITP